MKRSLPLLTITIMILVCSCRQKSAPVQIQVQAPAVLTSASLKMIAAKIYVTPGKEEEFIKSAKMIIDSTHTEPGCLEYTLYQDPNNKSNFLMFERYKNQAAIDAHFAAGYFKAFGKMAGELTSRPTEIKIYDITESK